MKYFAFIILLLLNAPVIHAQDNEPSFEDMYRLGIKSFENRNYQQAVTYLNKAIAAKPDAYDAYYYRSRSFYALRLTEPADADVEMMLKLKPADTEILRLKADHHFLSENFREAAKTYTRLISNGARKAEYYTSRGLAKQGMKDYFGSITDFDTALSLKPSLHFAQFLKAMSYKHLELLQKAEKEMSIYIRAEPNDKKGYVQRGLIYFDLGQGNKSIREFTHCLSLDSNDIEAYLNRGIVYYWMGRSDSAISDYNKVISLHPKIVEAYFNRAEAYKAAGKHDEAFDDYSKTIELDPGFTEAYLNRGVFYFDKGQYQLAIDDFNMAIQFNPEESKAYFNRGLSQFKLEEYDKALANFTRAIELNKQYAVAYHNRGLTKVKLGESAKSCSDFEAAFKLGIEESKEYTYLFCNN